MRKLKLFLATLTLLVGGVSSASAQAYYNTSWTAGVEVAAGGDFFLYNIGAGKFLDNGMNWGTRATVDNSGKALTFTASDGKYTIFTNVKALYNAGGPDGYLGSNCYLDGASFAWTFTPVDLDGYENVYKIGDGTNYLVYQTNAAGDNPACNLVPLSGTNNDYWLIITKDQRIAANDYTFLLDNTCFNRPWEYSVWQELADKGNRSGGLASNRCAEVYHKSFNMSQTISAGIPNGNYRLYAQGFSNNGDTEKPAFLYANDSEKELSILNAKAEGTVANMAGASTSFTYGMYVNYVDVTVTDGKLTIGVKTGSTGNWVIFNNFYLQSFSLESATTTYNKAKSDAKAIDQTTPMNSIALTSLVEAINETPASTIEDLDNGINTLCDATANAKASIAAYENAKEQIDIVEKELETTNVYDKEYFDGLKSAYATKTLTTSEAQALKAIVPPDGNARYESTFQRVMASLWTIGDKKATEVESGLYLNTWSNEGDTDGSDFKTPFFEYYKEDVKILDATTLSTTLTGLNANSTYSLSIRARVRQTNDKEKIANAITMKVGDGGAVDISAGDKFNDTKFFIGNFSAIGDTDADGKLTVTITVAENSNISWLSFRNVNYSDMSALITEFGELKTEANGLLENAEYTSITGTEKTALETASTATPSTFQQYTTAINALKDAIDTFKGAKASYDPLAKEIAKATALGVDATPYNATKASECVEKIQTLKVAEYEYVSTTFKEAVDLGTWNASEGTGTMTGQHWDGTSTSKYLEQSGANYNANSWTISYDQDLTLPAGNYVFKVAGRTVNTDKVSMGLVVKNGETTLGTVNDFPKGDVGLGINKKGVTSYNAEDAEGFANDGKGRGWEWRYVKFTLDNPATVNVAITASATASKCWVGFCNATVQTDDANIVDLMKALVALNDAKAKANLTKNTANVGTGVFQYNATTNDYLWTAYETAKDNADNFELTSTTVTAQVEALTKALNDAIDDYSAKQQLNAPDADKSYNIIVATADHAKKGNAVIIVPGNTSDNNPTGYAMNANFAINPNLNQAVKFTKVNGNTYNISFETEEGTTYLTYGTNNGSAASWKNSQIQATTNAENKGEFLIAATETDNVFNIYNTITNTTIACQNGGNIYTEAGNADFKLVEATKPSVAINTTETGWGTVMLPFAVAALPTDVKAYTCADAEGSTLTLVPANALKANTPYIIEGAWNETLYGNALGTALTNTEGWLTGVYVETDAPVGSYVLQNLDGVVGFYKVAENKQPKVGANHAYLTVQTAGGETAREAYFLSGEASGIMAIDALTSGNATIFNAAGAQIPALQKGMNIVRKADGKSYKVIVK